MIEYKIYGLVCPLTNEIRYIGYTSKTLNERLSNHMRDLSDKRWLTHKRNWLLKLKRLNMKPTIILLEDNIFSEDDACEYEIQYIKEYMNNGFNLTNSTLGGERSKAFKPEVVEKIKIGLKKYYETHDGWNKGIKTGPRSEETNRIQSEMFSGEKNPMYGINIFDKWREKYGEEKTEIMIKEWTDSRKKYDYDYNKLYDMFVIRKMKQIEISKEIGISRSQLCRVIKKMKLKLCIKLIY